MVPEYFGISYKIDIKRLDFPDPTEPITIMRFGLSKHKLIFFKTALKFYNSPSFSADNFNSFFSFQ